MYSFLSKASHIKRTGKILWIVLLVVISLPTLLFIAINNNKLQNVLAQRVTVMLSEKLGNHISMSAVHVSWFNRVIVNDLLVTDVHGDTILSTPELIGRLGLLAFSSRNIELRKATLKRADIRFAIDPETETINIKFIIDQLKSKDTTSNRPKWTFGMRSIELNDCRFTFRNVRKQFDRPFGMDYADLDVSHINLTISNFHPGDSLGGVKFRIRRLSCVEKCGIDLKFMSANFEVNRNNLSFKNVNINTSLSELQAKDISFHFDSFQDFGNNGFISKVMMSIDIQSSEVAFADLSQFAPYFRSYSDKAKVTGKVTGTVENLNGEKITVCFGDMTRINGNFDLKGLPNIRTTLIYADFTELETCPTDIERIPLLRSPTGHVNLSAAIHHLSTIAFKGKFTGFFDNFVTYGTFTTNLGNLSTDLSIKPVTDVGIDTAFTFRGALKTEQFHLGKLLTQPSMGEMTMTGMVEGSATVKGRIQAQVEGGIESINLRDYEYRNIAINGTVNNRMYDGQLSISEPNIKMDFSGKVDLTNPIPAYDFWANVERAKLYNLKLVNKDTSSFAAFSINAAFSGTNIDNLSGELELKNSLFRRNSREIDINNLIIFTKAISDTNRFILTSDILNAEIWGQYQFLKLPESFFSLVKNFAPAWASASVNPDSLSHNNFRFEAKFKNTQKLTNFFVNEFRVSRDTQLEGVYNPSQRDVRFLLDVPFMTLGNKQWRGLYLNGSIEDSTFVMDANCAAFRMNKNMSFENFSVSSQTRGDSVALDLKWNNWDSVLNKGSIDSKVFFLKSPKQRIPMIRIFSSPGQIVTAGDVWELTHQGISIDSTTVRFDSIRVSRGNQKILVSGIVSQREQDKLNISVKNLDLSVINSSMQFNKLQFGGIADGSASLSNLYEVPVFVSNIRIDDFSLNDSPFGSTHLAALWNSSNKSVRIDAESILNDMRTMLVKGDYFISDKTLDFDVSLGNIPVGILEPYIGNVFTGLEGTLSSKIKLTGVIDSPSMNGSIEMQQAALTLDYTKTRYRFSGTTTVKDNAILFKNFEMFDRSNNLCKITDGSIYTTNFKDIAFDLNFNANNLEVLNTSKNDNDLFYGKAFASGNIHIKGTPQDMYLDIMAKTEKNTQFFIPLSSNDEIDKTTFITFVDHTPRAQKRSNEYQRRRNVATSNEPLPEHKFTLNITLEATPDAETQLIFDPTIGDIIRAWGSGNLKLSVVNGRFEIIGTYTIERGNYRFTLKNLLANKMFTIEQGSVITWNGDPMGALLNLKARYAARPSLYDLMNAENFKRSVPVECVLTITNTLTDPYLKFDIDIPNGEQEVRSFLSAATNTEEEKKRQFIWLVATNHFFPDPNQSTANGSSSSGLETMGFAAAMEVLTNQLGYMLSNNNIDFDFSYRPGTYETSHIVGGGIVTDWWNFHVDYDVATENSDYAIGDFTFDMKLNKSGKLRFKAFRRTNARYLSQSPYTQGVGFLFREDFNQLKDLFKRKKAPVVNRREDENETPESEQVTMIN